MSIGAELGQYILQTHIPPPKWPVLCRVGR